MTRIIVTGNHWQDNIVLYREVRPGLEKELNLADPIILRDGGTAALKLFVEAVFSEHQNIVVETRPSKPAKPINVYWLWRGFPKTKNTPDRHKMVWRIGIPLGTQNGDAVNYPQAEPCNLLIIDSPDVADGSVLQGWPVSSKWSSIDHVLFRPGQSELSRTRCIELCKINALKKKLTVVLPIASARAWGANVPMGRYWGNTMVALRDSFVAGGALSMLKDVQRTVVYFPHAAIMVFECGRATHMLTIPDQLEGTWLQNSPGHFPGSASLICACLAKPLVLRNVTIVEALKNALLASAQCHLEGGGEFLQTPGQSWEHVAQCLKQVWASTKSSVLSIVDNDLSVPSLFDNCCSKAGGTESVATRIVQNGADALVEMPTMRYGKYIAVDPDEIERLHFLRGLIQDYIDRPNDKTPLGICVFGDPGSGKSFLIEQLIKTALGETAALLSFNMSQLGAPENSTIAMALHRVRDHAIKAEIPTLFFDEFDAFDLGWLQYFLAPLQDAQFWETGAYHPVGRSIFVFAGGTKRSFEDFADILAGDAASTQSVKAKKLPDFISRIRGFLNVQGPNCHDDEFPCKDVHLLRRAILFRALFAKHYPHLIDGNGFALIDLDVIKLFLSAKRFTNGARSIETILTSSRLAKAKRFSVSALPPKEQVRMHVSPEFYSKL